MSIFIEKIFDTSWKCDQFLCEIAIYVLLEDRLLHQWDYSETKVNNCEK